MGIKDTMRGGSGGTHAATGRQDFPHPQKDPEPELDLNALRKSVKDGNAPMVKHNQDEATIKREAKENPSQGPSMDDIRNAIKGQ